MTTQTVTHPVRSDVGAGPAPAPGARTSTRWALAGVGAGITGAGAIAASLSMSAVYDESLGGDTTKIADKLSDYVPNLIVFHVLGMLSAVLMIVFAAGLYRRLRATAPTDSIAPMIATFGLLGTAFVIVMGTGLDTEFVFGVGDEKIVSPDNAAFYNHWVGTIPWCWGLLGLSGIALFALARSGGVARWLGLVGLLGGGITLAFGISPLQYMAGFTGPIGLIVVALGFLVGDKAYRGR
ncbi:hypothetical protein [Nocardioides bizhenqiangii]|uniref:DUF4386 family protein n=1 Tax=Nocardioides bizhenqiangii TaxID=3095076 RepID=A0ABZ0ZST1_9ACTN|nr:MULTISPECIES: hypothetical protein [unclassified Nocardioides]MDZ5621945.1 hypothetical protein [Nocardioides sp. HM23]WQQ27373.1 hypothetical protein SHK19_03890 [Nocardioides sp. HM61]